MRTMDIPTFPEDAVKELEDLGCFIKGRLTGNVALYPKQSLRLISYMAWPNDETARAGWMRLHISSQSSEIRSDDKADPAKLETADLNSHWAATAVSPEIFLSKLKLIQQHWARTADIFHHHYDLTQGGHQKRRGGPSLSKAIHLVAINARAKGTGRSKLWQIWADYRDVAHLVTAAVLVLAEVEHLNSANQWCLAPGLLQPLQITDLLPDLVLAVARSFEAHGLEAPVHGSDDGVFDPSTFWRIPANIGLSPVPPLVRKLRVTDIVALNKRRSGHRGRPKNPSKATPVSD
jgi:hypothetical protein